MPARILVAEDDLKQAELIRRKGDEHERAYLAELRARGLRIIEVELGDELDWERAAAETAEALDDGVDVVYQAVFVHEGWRGIADFLERQPDGSYEVADTKLARTSKPAHILQLCFYTEQLARVTGQECDVVHRRRHASDQVGETVKEEQVRNGSD